MTNLLKDQNKIKIFCCKSAKKHLSKLFGKKSFFSFIGFDMSMAIIENRVLGSCSMDAHRRCG